MSESFLTRWSRRKQAAVETPTDTPESSPQPVPPIAPESPAEAQAQPPEPVLSDEELAALPSLNELTAETDITAFLRKGVPEVLRKAALRRAWALDPKVRDFVCEGREYAYDWNVPGGVPGAGPLLPTDDPQAMVERLFTKWRVGEDPGEVRDVAPAAIREDIEEPDADEHGVAVPAPVGEVHPSGPTLEGQVAPSGAGTNEPPRLGSEAGPLAVPADDQREIAPIRRHGGAMPV